jgi:hypothetical protein
MASDDGVMDHQEMVRAFGIGNMHEDPWRDPAFTSDPHAYDPRDDRPTRRELAEDEEWWRRRERRLAREQATDEG